jgi:hypothetical protein
VSIATCSYVGAAHNDMDCWEAEAHVTEHVPQGAVHAVEVLEHDKRLRHMPHVCRNAFPQLLKTQLLRGGRE